MKRGDEFLTPHIAFTGTKATIEAWLSPVEGMEAITTDTHEQGFYNGAAWVWGSGGGGVASVTGDGVDNTDPLNPVMSFPTPAEIGAAPVSHGSHIPVLGTITQLLQWASSGVAKWVSMSGDATILDGGAIEVYKTRENVRNQTGAPIATTRAVYISGYNSDRPLIALADNTVEVNHNVIGVTVGSIANNANGYIATNGLFAAETNAWAVGTELYLSTLGTLTSTPPTSGSVTHVAIVAVQQNYPNGKLLMYHFPEENYLAHGAGVDTIIRMGDSAGANKTSFRDYANTEVASINSDGAMNIVSGQTYKINGTAHTHTYKVPFIGNLLAASVPLGSPTTWSWCPGTTTFSAVQYNAIIPSGGTIKNLRLVTTSTQPSTGRLDVTVYVANVATALTLTVAANEAAGNKSDLVHGVSIADGGAIKILFANYAAAASCTMGAVSFEIEYTTP